MHKSISTASLPRLAGLLAVCAASVLPVAAQTADTPLTLADAVRIATEQRGEIEAARSRVRAGEARPAIVSALDDPMIASSLDHLPFMFDGADVSFTVEQRVPLSSIRQHRRASALGEVERLRAEAARTALDVGLEAATAFLMLQERQRMAALLEEQLQFARSVVSAADARYAGGAGAQGDVLRAEMEVARLDADLQGIRGEVLGAAAMLNASLGRDADAPVPPLAMARVDRPVPPWSELKVQITSRPELDAARAAVTRADADIRVMRDMARPMATIRTGPAYTMAEGRGWMAMVGISLPIFGAKNRAGVAEAQAMRQMSEAELRAMAQMIEGQAAAALRELQAAGARQAALRDTVLPRARVALDPALSAYAAGRTPLVTVLDAGQALWTVHGALIDADVRVGLAWTRLGRAIGSFEVLEP